MKGVILAAALAAISTSASARDGLTALTSSGQLVNFLSDHPGSVFSPVTVTGLGAGETLLAIDRMPDTDRMYGLTSSRIYQIDSATGVATAVSAPGAFSLSGSIFDMDFIPREYRIRVTSDTGQNFRINPSDGSVEAIDGNISYAAGDPNEGAAPRILAIAHNRNYGSGVSPQLYGVDTNLDVLVRASNARAGQFVTVGSLGVDISDQVSFDISGWEGPFIVGKLAGGSDWNVYQVNLDTGKTRFWGAVGGGYDIIDIAAGAVPEPASWTLMIFGFGSVGWALRRSRRRECRTVDDQC